MQTSQECIRGSATAAVAAPWDTEAWPAEVRLLVSVLEGHCPFEGDQRRTTTRSQYRVKTTLQLNPNTPFHKALDVYIRDASVKGLGFVCATDAPVGTPVTLNLPSPRDGGWQLTGRILRCRQFIPGWYEGAVLFDQPQPAFDPASAH